MDRKGENIIIYPAFMIIGYCPWFYSVSRIVLGCFTLRRFTSVSGYGNIQSVCQTIAVKSAPLERMGFATSTFFHFP